MTLASSPSESSDVTTTPPSSWRNTRSAWGGIARALHLSVAAGVAFQLGSILAFRVWHEAGTATTWEILNAHKAVGLGLLLLVLLRLGWRATSIRPDDPPALATWDRRASRRLEWALYACLIGLGFSGLVVEHFGGYYTPFFGLFYLDGLAPYLHLGEVSHAPAVEAARKAVTVGWARDGAIGLHVVGAFALIAAIAAHTMHIRRHSQPPGRGLLRRMGMHHPPLTWGLPPEPPRENGEN